MHKTVVLNVVGLTPALLSAQHTPRLHAFRAAGRLATVGPVLPAVTTTVQSTYITGAWPDRHGIVGNGWFFRDTGEVRFWLQSNALVQQEKIWDKAKAIDPAFTCANLFWWYNMYSSADVSVTPRPMYPADGRKIPDVYTHPPQLRTSLQEKLGQFPLFNFWGPATDIKATRWIADAAMDVDQRHRPTLSLVYLPHLDYVLQREGPAGPSVPGHLREVDAICGQLIDYYARGNARIVVLSEYGVAPVSRPVHINRMLREAGLLAIREELGRELLDAAASSAFAVADHQVAHVYLRDPSRLPVVRKLLEKAPGIALVLDEEGKRAHHLDHPRAGDLVCLAAPEAWFTYYYWTDDTRAPDFARTVDIHRKPGYDPVELFLDPNLPTPKLRIAWTLLKRKLGFRTLMQVIPLEASLIKGSHGLAPATPEVGPLCMTSVPPLLDADHVAATDICGVLMRHLFGEA